MAGPGLLLPWPHWVSSPQPLSPSLRVGLCEGEKDLEGNLPLALHASDGLCGFEQVLGTQFLDL